MINRAAAALLGLGLMSAAWGSGPFVLQPTYVYYPYSTSELLDGRIQHDSYDPTRFDRYYRALIAYLHLTEQFTPQHRVLLENYLAMLADPGAGSTWYYAPGVWADAVAAAGFPRPNVNTDLVYQEQYQLNGRNLTRYQYFQNCLADAFTTAADTLNQRKAQYGEGSAALQRWVDAQNLVFANCSSTEFALPAEPEASWSALEQADRAYQIAAAYFYNRQYQQAIARFEAISQDAASPWRDLSRYVIGRAYVREARINKANPEQNLQAAARQFRAVALSPRAEEFPSAAGMERYVTVQLDQAGFLADAAQRIIDAPESVDVQTLKDYLFVLQRNVQPAPDDDMTLWIQGAFTPAINVSTSAAVLQHWEQDPRFHWLYLAAMKTRPDEPHFDAILQALAANENTSRFFPLLVQRLHLLQQAQRFEEVAAIGTSYLQQNAASLSQAEKNAVHRYLAMASDDMSGLVEHALMPVVGLYLTDVGYRSLDETEGDVRALRELSFETDTLKLINNHFSLQQFLQLLEMDIVPPVLKAKIAKAGWVRALLQQDQQLALQFAPLVSQYVPRLAEPMQKYLEGANKEFEAAYLMLLHPGLSPYVEDALGRVDYQDAPAVIPKAESVALSYGDTNWWCAPYAAGSDDRLLQSFALTANADPQRRAAMLAVTEDFSKTITDYFSRSAIAYARANPDDERVPRALHRVVFATRYGCNRGGVGEVSRAAFQLLHARYPDSTWAAQTPYWYD